MDTNRIKLKVSGKETIERHRTPLNLLTQSREATEREIEYHNDNIRVRKKSNKRDEEAIEELEAYINELDEAIAQLEK